MSLAHIADQDCVLFRFFLFYPSLTSKTGVKHKSFIIFVYEAAQQQSKKLRKQEAGPKGFVEDRARKWLKQDSEKESRRSKKKKKNTMVLS